MLIVSSVEELVSIYGVEAERHLLRCCFSFVDLSAPQNGESSFSTSSAPIQTKGSQKDKEYHQQLLQEYFGKRVSQPGFASLLNSVLEQPLRAHQSSKSAQLLPKNNSVCVANFCRLLRLAHIREVTLRIELLESFGSEARSQSLIAIRHKLSELIKSCINQDNTNSLEEGLQVRPRVP